MDAPRTLQLERPLVCFDLETTGLDVVADRIVEIACVKLHADGRREVRTRRVNPQRPISPQASAVHGITDADVLGEPTFEQLARGLHAFLEGCDLTGFNVEHFDLPMLTQEFQRAGLPFPSADTRVIDSWRIFLAKEPRDLSAAYRFYCNATLEKAHSAEADATAAADVLLAQIRRYDDVPTTVAALHDFCRPADWIDAQGKLVWRDGEACLGFGKHANKPLRVMAKEQPDYLRWIAGAQFSRDVVDIVKGALNGVFPTPPAPKNGAHESKVGEATAAPAAEANARDAKPAAPEVPRGTQLSLLR